MSDDGGSDIGTLKTSHTDILLAIKNLEDGTLRAAISLTADLVGVVSIVGIPSAILSFLDLITNKGGQTDELLNHIAGLLRVTFDFDQSVEALTQMQRATDLAGGAESRVKALLIEQPPFDPSALDQVNAVTLASLDALGARPSWMRVYFDELLYRDGWFGTAKPPPDTFTASPGSSFIFDYRLTLPCYLRALAARLAALVVLRGASFVLRDPVIAEVSGRAAQLDGYYQTILRGWQRAPTPTFEQVAYLDQRVTPDSPPNYASSWDNFSSKRVIGVVDTYHGDGIVDAFPADAYPNPTLGPMGPVLLTGPLPEAYRRFAARYELGLRRREAALYEATSMGDTWWAIQQLRTAAGEPPAPFDPHRHSSLRDTQVALGTAAVELVDVPPIGPAPMSSLWDTVRRLAAVGNLDNSGQFQVSWRQALAAATP